MYVCTYDYPSPSFKSLCRVWYGRTDLRCLFHCICSVFLPSPVLCLLQVLILKYSEIASVFLSLHEKSLAQSGSSLQKIWLGGCQLGLGCPTVSHSGCHGAVASVDKNCCWWAEQHSHRAFLLWSLCQHPFLDTLEGIDMPQHSPRFAGYRLLGESSLSLTGPWSKGPHCGPAQLPGQLCGSLRLAVQPSFLGCSAQPAGRGELGLLQVPL